MYCQKEYFKIYSTHIQEYQSNVFVASTLWCKIWFSSFDKNYEYDNEPVEDLFMLVQE